MNCGLILNIAIVIISQLGLVLDLPKIVLSIQEESIGELETLRPTPPASTVSINITDISLLKSAPVDDSARIWALQLELMAIAEALFGPRDPSYQLFQPQFYENGPNLRFSLDQKGVWAELSYNGRLYWPTVLYELAHETFHLLNPGVLGTANNLEEGVAVAFSIYVQQLYGVNVQTPSIPSYLYALELVNELPGGLQSAIHIRRRVERLRDAKTDDLTDIFPGLDVGIAHALTKKFDRDSDPFAARTK